MNSIRDWVNKNKKIFWKYEVSYAHRTYIISVAHLPNPSVEDITVLPNNRLLKNDQKTQLYNTIKKACVKPDELSSPCINVELNYVGGAVTAAVVSAV